MPILRSLREDGLIDGWGHWSHHTGGGEYNVRFAIRFYDWDDINTFWSET